MMIEREKHNFGLFMTSTIIYSVVHLIAIIVVCLLPYDGFFIVAILLWQFAHIGLCCYFYFSDARMPMAARVYLYIDLVIVGFVLANQTLFLILQKCPDSDGNIAACLLRWAASFAESWGYHGCNLLMAYCVLYQQKSNRRLMLCSGTLS